MNTADVIRAGFGLVLIAALIVAVVISIRWLRANKRWLAEQEEQDHLERVHRLSSLMATDDGQPAPEVTTPTEVDSLPVLAAENEPAQPQPVPPSARTRTGSRFDD